MKKELKEIIKHFETLKCDMEMLRDGEWVPDGSGDSEDASIEIAEAGIKLAEKLMKSLDEPERIS